MCVIMLMVDKLKIKSAPLPQCFKNPLQRLILLGAFRAETQVVLDPFQRLVELGTDQLLFGKLAEIHQTFPTGVFIFAGLSNQAKKLKSLSGSQGNFVSTHDWKAAWIESA